MLGNQTLYKLPYRFLSITGEDAIKFLQGQVSCDIETLTEDKVSFGTCNTPKGRIYGLFVLARVAEGLILRLNAQTFDHCYNTLKKYAVFFKCELREMNELFAYGCLSFEHKSQQGLFHDRYPDVEKALNDAICFQASPKSSRLEIWSTEASNDALTTDSEIWMSAETRDGLPEIYPETLEAFVLQTLNLDKLGGVSFKKGCYTGQEIIARMKFLGKVKKRAQVLVLSNDNSALPPAGASVTDEHEKRLGELVRIHHAAEETYALAVLPVEDPPDTVIIGGQYRASLVR